MAETDNIARLAGLVSNDLFARFFWRTTGSVNQNWPCESEKHRRKTQRSGEYTKNPKAVPPEEKKKFLSAIERVAIDVFRDIRQEAAPSDTPGGPE
jgi:hypothetical protein